MLQLDELGSESKNKPAIIPVRLDGVQTRVFTNDPFAFTLLSEESS